MLINLINLYLYIECRKCNSNHTNYILNTFKMHYMKFLLKFLIIIYILYIYIFIIFNIVPMKNDMVDVNAFEKIVMEQKCDNFLTNEQKIFWAMFYTIPTFHNPTGSTLSVGKLKISIIYYFVKNLKDLFVYFFFKQKIVNVSLK